MNANDLGMGRVFRQDVQDELRESAVNRYSERGSEATIVIIPGAES
jgi:hypothetical protein